MRRVEFNPEGGVDFQRFVSWRAQCLEREERIEAIDDSLVPDEFAEHVHRYRFGRAAAIVDREGNPEAAGLAAVRTWLQTIHAAGRSAHRGGLGNRSCEFYAQLRTSLLREGLGIGDHSNREDAVDPPTRDVGTPVRRVVVDVDDLHEA